MVHEKTQADEGNILGFILVYVSVFHNDGALVNLRRIGKKECVCPIDLKSDVFFNKSTVVVTC